MFPKRLLFLAGLVLASVGCAYRTAMNTGARLESSGDLVGAYAQFEAAAKKKPDEPEATQAQERVRDAIVAKALEDARKALNTANYERTIEKLELASSYDGDRPEVFELRSETKMAMTSRYERFIEVDDYEAAYDIAVRTRKLVPAAEYLEEAFPALRQHFIDASGKQLRAKEFPEALETARTIVEYEPDRTADIAELEQSILTKWGADEANKGRTMARSRRMGAAAVHYARAYEIAGQTSYLDESRAIVTKLEPEGRLAVQLRLTGSRDRTDPLKQGLEEDLAAIPDTRLVPSRAQLGIRLDLRTARCTEEDEVTPTEKDFVSGQVEEPNPEFHRLTDELATQRELEAEAKRKAEVIWPDMIEAEKTLKLSESALNEATRERDAAKTSLSDAEDRLARTKTLAEQLKEQLDAATVAGDSTTVKSTRTKLEELAPVERSWVDEIVKRRDALEAAERKLQGIETDRGPAKEAAERLRSGHDALIADKEEAAGKARELASKLSTTSETVWKDVHELLKYDIHDYTRTCVAPLSATLTPSWESQQSLGETYAPSHATKDRAHIGHEKAEVEEDLKAFPETDAQLIAKGDQETRKALAAWLKEVVADHYSVRRMQTTLDLVEHPEDPTELLRLYVGAQGRLDEADIKMFAAHLKTHFGLEKIELLRAP